MHVDDPALYEAIGRVAAQSALFDEELRGIYELAEGRDYLWPLFEGQGTDWLIKTLLSILDNIDPRSHFLSAEHHARLRSALKEVAKNLSPMRNVVIHGTWSHKPTHRD